MFNGFKAEGMNHLMGAPLIEFKSVTIHLNAKEKLDSELEIYGSIQITNGRGELTCLYDQSEHYPDKISSGDTLLLRDIHPIYSPFPVTKIHFHLMDKTGGRVLVDESLTFDYTKKSIKFEEKGERFVHGKHGSVEVGFTAYESAVMANIDFELWKNNDFDKNVPEDNIVVVGSIVASYDSKCNFFSSFETIFLDAEPEEDALLVECRLRIPVYKSQVAVPVDSTSAIQISANFPDLKIIGSVTSPIQSSGRRYYMIKGSGGYYLQVYVNWVPGNVVSDKVQEKVIGKDQPQPYDWKLPDQRQEVYSFAIIPDEKHYLNNEVLNLHGQVDFVTTEHTFCLYKTDEGNPISFRPDQVKTFYVNIPYRFFGDHWSKLQVKVMDMDGRIFCEGFISWHPDAVVGWRLEEVVGGISWYDRFLCSTINGEYGLVKVYHSFLKHAVPAIVKILPYFEDGCRELRTDVSGMIFARYDRYVYNCSYYRNYFQNVLFSESLGSPSNISIGGRKEVEWLKSVISVPYDSALIIEFDLCLNLEEFKHKSPLGNDIFKDVAKFEVGCQSSKQIRKKDLVFEVSVEWPEFSKFQG